MPFNERSLIEDILAPLSKGCAGAFELKDDAALIKPRPGYELVVSKDALVAGVHFFASDKPEDIAVKALRVNLSDLYAKGADARYYLLSLFLPADIDENWLRRFADGLDAEQKRWAIHLLGGDSVRINGPFCLSVTMIGEVPAGEMVHRMGASPGDIVFVSGVIGDAALGLEVINKKIAVTKDSDKEYLLEKYLLPDIDCKIVPHLRRYASAAMDISDGLAGDLAMLCRASGLGARLYAGDVPLSGAARRLLERQPELLDVILTGGDDYKILCTIAAAHSAAFENACGGQVYRIGEIIAGEGELEFIGINGQTLALGALSYIHFEG